MTNVLSHRSSSPSRQQLRFTGEGIIDEPYPFMVSSTAAALTSQRVYGVLLGLRAGDSVTGLMLRLGAAAAGTSPTLARFGLADATGKILVLSADLGAAANWAAGPSVFPFTAPYAVSTDGGYFGCLVVNGSWGSTQPTLAAPSGLPSTAGSALGASAPPLFTWDSQTDLPAVNSSLTMTAAATVRYVAAYGTAAT